jgi:propionyl-CoA carboxylase alpha chain
LQATLVRPADGVVKKVVAAKGESLTVDQMIVEFE